MGATSEDEIHPRDAYGFTLKFGSAASPSPEGREADISVVRDRIALGALPHWYHRWERMDGVPWLLFGRVEDSYYLRFPGLADFRISRASPIEYWPAPDLPPSTFYHFLFDTVLPLYLSLTGELVCHGSAATDGTGTVGFVGPSGSGKSTLAGFLAVAGWQVIADDALVVRAKAGRFEVVPAYPGLRLWPDTAERLYPGEEGSDLVAHYMPKLRVVPRASRWPPPTTPLKALFVVQPGDELRVELVSRRDAVIALTANLFQIEVGDPSALDSAFAKVSGLVRDVPVMRLTVPRDWDRLPAVEEAIVQAAGLA